MKKPKIFIGVDMSNGKDSSIRTTVKRKKKNGDLIILKVEQMVNGKWRKFENNSKIS